MKIMLIGLIIVLRILLVVRLIIIYNERDNLMKVLFACYRFIVICLMITCIMILKKGYFVL
nr:MAG TPA: hypothetical protein [Caudoviricetes sp.]